LALTPGDPIQTAHFKVAAGFDQVLAYTFSSVRAFPSRDELAKQAASNDPADRREYLFEAALCWTQVGWLALLGMVGFGFLTKMLLGHVPGAIVFSAWAAVAFFCFAGACNVYWRWVWYLPRARRRARKNGVGSAPFAAAMRAASPRNSSLIFQWTVGIVVFGATVAAMV
jgi:ABC-type glycerol-3-phosphate transport system substrate-binding protein